MWDAWGTWQTWCVAGFALWVAWKLLNIVSGALIRLLGSRALSPLAHCLATISPAFGYFFQQYPPSHTSKKRKEKEIPSEPEGSAPLLLPPEQRGRLARSASSGDLLGPRIPTTGPYTALHEELRQVAVDQQAFRLELEGIKAAQRNWPPPNPYLLSLIHI